MASIAVTSPDAPPDAPPDAHQALHCLPLVVTYSIDVAGRPTTVGSRVHEGHVLKLSAIARLQQAGAIVLGKTNLNEFCVGVTFNNGAFSPVRNPHAPDRIAGGCGGGTASAIEAGLAPASIGSDTGGSMRIPAALCGVVGFTSSTGRWPSDGIVKISDIRDTLGPMAHTVADYALLDAVVCNAPLALTAASLKGVRIGVPRLGFWQPLETSVKRAAEAALVTWVALVTLVQAGAGLVACDVGVNKGACSKPAWSSPSPKPSRAWSVTSRSTACHLTPLPSPPKWPAPT